MPAAIFMALAQVLGVASILPFLTLVANPDGMTEHEIYQRIDAVLHFASPQQAIITAGFVSLIALVISNGVAALTAYLQARFVWRLHQKLQFRLMRTYLNRKYEFFLNRNSADLGKNILEEVSYVVRGVVVPVLEVLSNGLVALFVVGLMIAADPMLGLTVLVVFGALYAASFSLVNRFLTRLGLDRVAAGRGRFQSIREAFGAIKDVKAHGHESVFLQDFDGYSKRWSKISMQQSVVQQTPRFILEILAFGGIIAIVLFYITTGQDIASILPTLGLYAFGSYRLMPSLHRVYESGAALRGSLAALDVLYDDGMGPRAAVSTTEGRAHEPVQIEAAVTFDDVTYRYPGAPHDSLRDVNVRLQPGTSIALVGTTGAGKTTFIDLLLGLLSPTSGTIRVDDKDLAAFDRAAWQAGLGYVPQQIYLTDTTVAENIAFGVPLEDIDEQRLQQAGRAARIHDFVMHELPDGYATFVGEQGARLSGGQRQRIGIARALYRNPSVLVLDEATSALDSVTETEVMRGIQQMPGQRLVVMVAHRISTIHHCDQILVLQHGRVAASGTFDELMATNALFRSLAQRPELVPNG